MKQFSPSCARNKDAILAVLQEVLPAAGTVLEVGSGTGQHAAFFAGRLPGLDWQPSDLAASLPSIRAWTAEAGRPPNLRPPLVLDLLTGPWPPLRAEAVVCINTIHIVSWEGVVRLFQGAAEVLVPGGVFFAYGPYRYASRPLEASNEAFDAWLKARDPASGVRDFAAVDALARTHGLTLAGDRAMPANNRSLWWIKGS